LKLEVLEEENVANVANVAKLIKGLGIECDLRDVETLDIFTDFVKWEAALEALAARKEVLKGNVETAILTKHRVWTAKETREELLVPEGMGAISFPAYALSPYKFVCALLEICIQKGLNFRQTHQLLKSRRILHLARRKNGLFILGGFNQSRKCYSGNECLHGCALSARS
jgi:hypothetical protein